MSHIGHFKPAFSTGGIDAKATGATTIGTTRDSGERFVPLYVVVELTAAAALTIVPTISVGTNGASYNNLLVATALTGISATNNVVILAIPPSVITSVPPGTPIKVNITIGATATTATVRVDVVGYYI